MPFLNVKIQSFQSQSQFRQFLSNAINPYWIWVYGVIMTILVRNDSESFQSHFRIADDADFSDGRGWESV